MQFQLFAEGNRSLTGQTDHGQAVRTVGGDLKLNGHIVQTNGGTNVLTDLTIFLHDENTVFDRIGEVVCGQTQLTERAEHTVGNHAAQFTFADLFTAGQNGFILCNRNDRAGEYVGRTGNDLDRFCFTDIQLADDQFVCIGVGFDGKDLTNNNVFDLFAFDLPAFYFRTGNRHSFGIFTRGNPFELYEIGKPSHR